MADIDDLQQSEVVRIVDKDEENAAVVNSDGSFNVSRNIQDTVDNKRVIRLLEDVVHQLKILNMYMSEISEIEDMELETGDK